MIYSLLLFKHRILNKVVEKHLTFSEIFNDHFSANILLDVSVNFENRSI